MTRNTTPFKVTLLFLLFSLNVIAATRTSTATGGDWNLNTTWVEGIVPTIDDDVTIALGSTVSIGTSSSQNTYIALCKTLTVNGVLNCHKNKFFVGYHFNNGGNFPVLVNGTLSVQGDFDYYPTISGYLKFEAGSTFNMSSGAFVINGNTGTASTSVAMGQALLDVSNIGTLNTSGGTLYVINPHFVNGEPCIKGAKTFGNTISLGNAGISATSTDYIISETEKPVFNNLEVNYLPNGTNKARLKGLTINGVFGVINGFFNNAGGSEKIFVKGDMNIGTGGYVEGSIEFNGSIQQNINPLVTSITGIQFKGDVTVNSTNRVKMKLNIEIPLPYTLRLDNGIFDVGNEKTLVLNKPVVINSPSNSTFISTFDLYGEIGTLEIKNMTSETLFPIGYEQGASFSSYTPLKITPSVSSSFRANVRPINVSTTGFEKINLQWDISRDNGASADITFQWNTQDEVGTFGTYRNNAKVYHNSSSAWNPISTAGANTNVTTHSKTVSGISSFSIFSVLTNTVLPVSFVSFKAKSVGKNAILTWSTASEKNNAGFDIEKSQDGKTFETIGFVKGMGNANILSSYIFADENFTEAAYYRLKQMDLDGSFTYSNTVQLEKSKTLGIKVYPNPIAFNTPLSIEVVTESQEPTTISLTDISGRVISQNTYSNSFITMPTQDLARGLYFVKIQNGSTVSVQKVIKN